MAKLLLVEDSPTARSLVRVFLMGVPCEIVEAASAEAALQMLDDVAIEVLVVDHQLPGMEGLEFIKRLRIDERAHVQKLGLVMLTAQDLEVDAYRSGADAYIKKPVKDGQLRDAVLRLLNRKPTPYRTTMTPAPMKKP